MRRSSARRTSRARPSLNSPMVVSTVSTGKPVADAIASTVATPSHARQIVSATLFSVWYCIVSASKSTRSSPTRSQAKSPKGRAAGIEVVWWGFPVSLLASVRRSSGFLSFHTHSKTISPASGVFDIRPFIDFVARVILALSHRASGAFSALGGKAVFRAYSRLSVRQFRSTRAHSAKVSDRSGDSIDWTGKNLFALRGNQWLREGPRHAAEQSHRAGRDVVDLHIEHGTIAAIEPIVHRERDEPSTCENGCSCPVRPMRTRIWTKP